MASGGYQPNKQTKGEPKRRSNWQRSVSSDRDDAQSLNSLPSDIRINNWDLSDLRPTNLGDDSKRRKKSKGNPEREREQSLTMDSPPHDKKHHTPSSYPRTKITPSTPTSQRVALENLKQHITFSDLEDQVSTDGERNNERQMSQGRRRLHNTSLNRTDCDNESLGTRERRINRNNNMDHSSREQGPDSNEIVARLMQIREFMKQARSMLESMEKLGDKKKTEDVEKVRRLIRNLQEQEQGYKGLLQNSLAHREDTGNEAAGGEDVIKGESKDDSDTSVDLDVKSENSDTSENSQDSRPRIESKLGIGSNEDEDDDKDNDDDDDDDDDVNLEDELFSGPMRGATGNSSGNAIAIKTAENESSSHSHLIMTGMPVQESEEGMRGATEIVGDGSTPQQQELLRILREKQQQLQALMSRQEELNLKRRETEKKLLEAQARDNKARAALAAVSTGRQFVESRFQSHLALTREAQAALADSEWGQEDTEEGREAAGGEDRVLKSNIVGYPVSDDEDNSKVREVESLPTELLELKRQLNYLRNEFSQVSQAPKNVESESRAVVDGRQQLQNKLQELQDKKSRMDTLLQELQMLHAQPLANLRNNESSAPTTSSQAPALVATNIPSQRHPAQPTRPQMPAHIQSRMNDMATATPGAVESAMATFALLAREAGRNQEAGSVEPEMVSEVQEKLRRLKEVRGQLDELRRLVQYYQGESNEASRDQDDQTSVPGFSDGGDHAGIKDQASVEIRGSGSSQQQQLQQLINAVQQQQQRPQEDATVGASSIDNMVQLLNLAGTDQGDELSDEDNVSASQSESQWSRLGPWDDDPEIQEKVLKLKAAKEKLRQLQDLVAFVQQSPETARSVPDHLGDLAASVEGEAVSQATQTDEPNVSVSEGEVPSERVQQRHAGVEESDNPRIELERLKKERAMLLEIQSQLKHIQNQTPGDQGRVGGQTSSELVQTRPEQSTNAPVVTFASNDELYSKMRRQRILQEELRSKKKELEAIMKKDRNKRQYSRNQDNQSDTVSLNTDTFGIPASVDATMATWGGSTVDNLENITEDGQERNAGDGDEDDGYPSDGIVQVEEEEEENDSDNGTYTIEADARQRTNTRKGGNLGTGARPKTARGRQTYPQPSYNDKNVKTKSQRQNSQRSAQNQRDTKLRQENYRSAKELMEDDETTKEKTSEWFCFINERLTTLANSVETLLRKSDTENRQLSVSLNQETAPQTATLISPMQEQMLQLQSQSMMLSFGHVVQTLTRQQVEMQQLQQQMQALQLQIHEIHEHSLHGTGLAPPSSQLLRPALSNPTLNNSNYNLQTALGAHPFSLNQQAASPYAQGHLNNTASAGLMSGFASPGLRNFHQTAGLGLSAGNLSGHADRGQGGYGNGLSVNTGSTSSLPQQGAVAGFIFNPLGQSPVNPSTSHTSMTRDFSQFVNTVDAAPSPHGTGFHQFSNHNLFGSSSQQQQTSSVGGFPFLSSQLQGAEEREEDNPAPRLNSYHNGSRNKKRKASNRNSNPGNAQTSGLRMSTPRENSESVGRGRDLINDYSRTNYEPVSGFDVNTAFDAASSYSSVQSIRDEHTRLRAEQTQTKSVDASNDGNTLFDTLRDAIYSEVASLISQNESRPQFLLELFRDMQQVDSDQLRQRTLYSLQEVLSSHIKSISGNSSAPSWVRATSNAGDTGNSEQTPSESVTSDDEDFKVTRLKEKASAGNRLDRITRNTSLRNFPYDFVEMADNPSSLSTPTNGCEDSPFFQDTLGETVIELNSLKQDQEARGLWGNRQGANANHSEHGRQAQQVWGAGGFLASEQLLKDMKRRTRSKKSRASGGTSQSSEVTNSSAVEEASQSSFSEMPYPRIDMKQLDRQIKDIMMKTIPVVKEHMDDICSTQLLAYVKRLVLSLTSQIGNQEFARFFQRQLSSLLQDTLQKYHGRKMRECGEDLLVEISDVLFNELAFFRLMQDLDDPNVAEKMKATEFPTQTSKESSVYSVESSCSDIDDEARDDDGDKKGDKTEENIATGSDSDPRREFNMARQDVLGQDRNEDERAIEKSEKDFEEKEEDEGEHSYKIELAPSETKPFTRIGSDEDDDDSDEEQSMDDPSETAVSRDSMLESNGGSRVSPKTPEAETPQTAGSATIQKSVGEGETTPSTNNVLPVDSSQMNGITNGNNSDEELTVDDLPERLTLPPAAGNTD